MLLAQLREEVRHFEGRVPGRRAAIHFILETSLPGLFFVFQTQHRINHRDTALERDLLQCLSHDLRAMYAA